MRDSQDSLILLEQNRKPSKVKFDPKDVRTVRNSSVVIESTKANMPAPILKLQHLQLKKEKGDSTMMWAGERRRLPEQITIRRALNPVTTLSQEKIPVAAVGFTNKELQ